MDSETEQEILQSEYAGLYVVGKCLQLFARLNRDQRRITFLRLEVLLKVYGVNQ